MKKIAVITIIFSLFSNSAFSLKSKHDALTRYGDIAQLAIPAFAGLYSFYEGDSEGLEQLGVSLFATYTATSFLKHSVDRIRPNGSRASFPSGHTAAAFVGATYFHHRYDYKYSWLLYGASALVGISRVHGNYHHVTDVLAGGALAYFITQYFTTPINEKDSQLGVGVSVDSGNKAYGLKLSYKF